MFVFYSPLPLFHTRTFCARILFFAGLFALLLAAHLRHAGVLWEGDDLPLAAALQMMHGSVLYRDIWFDKPPLVPAVYLLWGARIGPVLRVAGAVYAFARLRARVCVGGAACGRGARAIGRRGCSAFFLTFDTHSAVLPLAADLLLLAPHLAAVLLASREAAVLERGGGGDRISVQCERRVCAGGLRVVCVAGA